MSAEGSVVLEGGTEDRRLPRGRHGLPRELVIANQRERMLGAATEVFAEAGYASLSVGNVISLASVSRSTFYAIFEDKLDCVASAQQRAFEHLLAALEQGCAAVGARPSTLAAALDAALEFAHDSPAEARLVLASSVACTEPQLARRGPRIEGRLLDLLRDGAARWDGARLPTHLSERAALGAAMSIVAACLATEEADALPELTADLVQILLTPYFGAEKAKRMAWPPERPRSS